MTIYLFTDFGSSDLYVGQAKAALFAHGANEIMDLLNDAPDFDIQASAHLLAALHSRLKSGAVVLAVVDPGVGGRRGAVVLEAERKYFVGPDNGLLSVVAARAETPRTWRIVWRPEHLSASFHGRDLFAPIAALIDRGDFPLDKLEPAAGLEVQLAGGDLFQVIYLDHYGNVMTGIRARTIPRSAVVRISDQRLSHAAVFSDVPPGALFWYENSIGLVELAANRASAARELKLRIGDVVEIGGSV
jgi:S-adenosylmethionine hydrolase